jgi:ribosomal protein L11 methyltransferase
VAQSWLQLSIRTRAASIDALANFLMERGAPGVIFKNNGVDAFFAAAGGSGALRRDVERFVDALARLSPRAQRPQLRWRPVKQESWEHSWKRFIKPRRVGKNFWVTPPWLEPPKFRRRRVITIEPGLAFGTGTHATTRGCMELIERARERIGERRFTALDVGTGSGILAIALAHLGASEVAAIDNDPVALEVARGNLRANGVAKTVRLSGTKLTAIRRRFDVVVANLTAETIMDLAGGLEKSIAANGFLVLSGILRDQSGVLTRRFGRRFRVVERKPAREWTSLLLQRK